MQDQSYPVSSNHAILALPTAEEVYRFVLSASLHDLNQSITGLGVTAENLTYLSEHLGRLPLHTLGAELSAMSKRMSEAEWRYRDTLGTLEEIFQLSPSSLMSTPEDILRRVTTLFMTRFRRVYVEVQVEDSECVGEREPNTIFNPSEVAFKLSRIIMVWLTVIEPQRRSEPKKRVHLHLNWVYFERETRYPLLALREGTEDSLGIDWESRLRDYPLRCIRRHHEGQKGGSQPDLLIFLD